MDGKQQIAVLEEMKNLLGDLQHTIWKSQALHAAVARLTPLWGSESVDSRTNDLERRLLSSLTDHCTALDRGMDSIFHELTSIRLNLYKEDLNG